LAVAARKETDAEAGRVGSEEIQTAVATTTTA